MGTYEALQVVLDQVDYTAGNCGPTEMVAACLPKEVIRLAREALSHERERIDGLEKKAFLPTDSRSA